MTPTSWMRGLACCAALVAASASAQDRSAPMPPNPDKIAAALLGRGEIPANATPEQREATVQAYLQLKLAGSPDGPNGRAKKLLDRNEQTLDALAPSAIRGRKLGSTVAVEPSTPGFKSLQGQDKLVLILVEFSPKPFTWTPDGGTPRTAAGPLHNQLPVPDNSFDLWVSDFGTGHYEDMLFTPGGWTFPQGAPRYAGDHRGSMHDFYLVQSFGRYTVSGTAYGWFQVDKPEAFYGDDDPAGGHDNLIPGTARDLIADAIQAANAQGNIPWEEYDTDGDCVIDHPLFIHAGADQSGGGGAQGDDAIWAHSWSVDDVPVTGPTAACPNGLVIRNYTIMPEDGGVGVFAHEFGHDLGLPDEYDTIYSGRGDSVANWSIMSGGSWVGRPAQTQPSDMSIWARQSLGWLVPGDNFLVTSADRLSTTPAAVRLEQSERWGGAGTLNAVRINLPPKQVVVNVPHSGVTEWFGGKADLLDSTLTRTVDLRGKAAAALSFWTWYDLEPGWDFAFVQVSADGGATWTSLPIAGTTSELDPAGLPAIRDNLPGFTGRSGGWVQKGADLSAWGGQTVQLRFRYMTDWATTMAGFYVDDVRVTADGATVFLDDVETLDPAWTAVTFRRDPGYAFYAHYYLAEWRNTAPLETPWGGASIVNFDAGLRQAYQFDPYGSTGNAAEPSSAAPRTRRTRPYLGVMVLAAGATFDQ